jgi:glutathione S-transferase
MTITLYHASGSRSTRIIWLLEELGLDYDCVAMGLAELIGSKEFKQINRLGRVPFLVEDDTPMLESLAIVQHRLETHDGAGRLHPLPGTPERREWLEWTNFAETMGVHVANLNQQINVIRPAEARSEVTIKLEKRRFEKTVEMLETRLAGRDFVLDRGFTSADIALGWSVHAGFDFVFDEPFPLTRSWLARLKDRPAAALALAGRLSG